MRETSGEIRGIALNYLNTMKTEAYGLPAVPAKAFSEAERKMTTKTKRDLSDNSHILQKIGRVFDRFHENALYSLLKAGTGI